MNTHRYILEQAWQREKERLEALAAVSDPFTIGHLLALGVRAEWCCAEVGAGSGSIARWLVEQVGDTRRVVATDIDTRFLAGLDQSPHVEVRRHDIIADPLEAGRYDLIHTRYLLMHLPERERAIEHLVDALRPGGWLLVEDGDFRNYQRSYPPVAALAATQGILPCGSDKISVFTLLLAHLQNALIAAGLTTASEVEAAIKILQAPSPTAVYGPILVSAWGQRPF